MLGLKKKKHKCAFLLIPLSTNVRAVVYLSNQKFV